MRKNKEEKRLLDSLMPKNEFHAKKETLINETKEETYLSQFKKRARKIKEEPLMRLLKKKKKLEVNF